MGVSQANILTLDDFKASLATALEFAEANWDVMDRCEMQIAHHAREVTWRDSGGFREYVEGPKSLTISMVTKRPESK